MDKIPDTVLFAASIIIFTSGSVWGLAWWLSGKFSEVRHLVYDLVDKAERNILSKLEYHEKHDDSRFDSIKKDMFAIQIKQAAGLKDLQRIMEEQ
jgi:hypothetical protein